MVRNDHKFFGGEGLHRIYPIVLINGKEFAYLLHLFFVETFTQMVC